MSHHVFLMTPQVSLPMLTHNMAILFFVLKKYYGRQLATLVYKPKNIFVSKKVPPPSYKLKTDL